MKANKKKSPKSWCCPTLIMEIDVCIIIIQKKMHINITSKEVAC